MDHWSHYKGDTCTGSLTSTGYPSSPRYVLTAARRNSHQILGQGGKARRGPKNVGLQNAGPQDVSPGRRLGQEKFLLSEGYGPSGGRGGC